MMRSLTFFTITLLLISVPSRAGVMEFTDKDEWFALADNVTTIDFTGFPSGTIITDQYADSGITFLGLNNSTIEGGASMPNDGWGLHSPGGTHFVLDTPMYSVAIDHPGVAQFELYSGGELIHTSRTYPKTPRCADVM